MKENNIIIYEDDTGLVAIDVKLHDETLWLDAQQIADLFNRDKSVILKHIRKIYKEHELTKKATVANFATVQKEGNRNVKRDIEHYNLDVIISVGYRVNSKQGTKFRQWSNKILKEYLVNGYSLNRNNLTENKLKEISETIDLLSKTLINQSLVNDVGNMVINIIKEYAKTWHVLLEYDEGILSRTTKGKTKKKNKKLDYKIAKQAISDLKQELIKKKEASALFGNERDKGLEAILKNLEQTFAGESLYKSYEEKAAHLLYFVIKDHPFTDGNKRIGSLLFLLYSKLLYLNLKLNDNGLIALALLIAESSPKQKELMINLVINLFD